MSSILSEAVRVELVQLGSATLHEACGASAAVDPAIRPAWPGSIVCGPALTVRVAAGDNLALHHAVAAPAPGRVLVVDAGAGQHGFWGEVLAVAALQVGVSGIVIDGGVRDTDRLAALGFGAFSRWVALHGTTKHDRGEIGAPVNIGGRTVHDGDIVVGDADGIAIIAAKRQHEVLMLARAREAKEREILARIRDGATTVALYDLDDLDK